MKNGWRSLGAALIIILLTLAAYRPVMRAGFIWDDDAHVTANSTLRTVEGLRLIWSEPQANQQYYPLQLTSFWLEYHLWGLQPFGYHLVNILLHALNALLLWQVLRKLEIAGAWLAAAIFALHPVQVESVAWVTELKNVLSCFFYLLAALAYLRFRPLTEAKAAGAWDWRFYPLVIVLFLCALLSKTVTCSLPAVLMLLVWWKTGRVERRDALALAPLFVVGAGLGLVTVHMEKHAGAIGAEWTLSFVQRCLIAGRALWFYAGKLFWPRQLTFIYPRWEIDAGAWWQYAYPVAALVVVVGLWWWRQRIGRGPLVAVLCFAGTLAPALGFFDVYPFRFSYVADHFQYLASIALIALVAGAGAAMCHRAGARGRRLGGLAAVIVLVTLGVCTWRQAHIYRDQETLWRDTLAKNPTAWMAQNNLSGILIQNGRIEEAMSHSEQAVRIKPDYAEARINLALALAHAGRVQEAIEQYERALQIKPDYVEAHDNLAATLEQAGRVQEAMEHWKEALRLNPGDAVAHNNLGNALNRAGETGEAIGHYEQAIRIKPDFAEAHYNLGAALGQAGRFREAIGHYEQAIRVKADYAEAQNNLAWLLATLSPAEGGDPVRAVSLAQRACALTGNRASACVDTLAAAYAATGQFGQAITTAENAIELARSAGQTQLLGQIEMRLKLYRDGHTYR